MKTRIEIFANDGNNTYRIRETADGKVHATKTTDGTPLSLSNFAPYARGGFATRTTAVRDAVRTAATAATAAHNMSAIDYRTWIVR